MNSSSDYQVEMLDAYVNLTFLVPIMITILVVVVTLILICLISMNSRLQRFHLLVDRIFTEKLDQMDKQDEVERMRKQLEHTRR